MTGLTARGAECLLQFVAEAGELVGDQPLRPDSWVGLLGVLTGERGDCVERLI